MRAHRLWNCLIGIIWGLGVCPVAAAEAPAVPVPLCQRTPRVRDALVRATCSRCACTDVTSAQLASLRELNLSRQGLTRLKAGDFSGLSALETLDLTGNPLKALPDSLAAELHALKRLKMDLTLFTRLPDEVVNPLLNRPGFRWNMTPSGTCKQYDETPGKEATHLLEEEFRPILEASGLSGSMDVRAWRRGIYLAGVEVSSGKLSIASLRRDASQRLTLFAKTEELTFDSDSPSYAFDFAPYRLSPDEVGFGIRSARSSTIGSRLMADEDELRVFRLHGNRIEQVLRTVVYTQHERIGPPKGASEEEEEDKRWYWREESCSVIAVAQSKTQGVFNWVKVQSSSTTRPLDPGEQPALPFPAAVFRWNGRHFEAQEDPTTSLLFRAP